MLDGLHDEADAAAQRVDRAAQEVLDAVAHRQSVEARVTALASAVRNVRPGDVARTRSEALAREAARLIDRDGEQAPNLTVDPRQARHGATIQPLPEAF